MKKQFLLTLLRLFPDQKKDALDVLADHLVIDTSALLPEPDSPCLQDDAPDVDLDGNPLDGDLPAVDDGRWLDHSPANLEGPPPDLSG